MVPCLLGKKCISYGVMSELEINVDSNSNSRICIVQYESLVESEPACLES